MAKKKTAPKTESEVLPVDDAALERLQSSILDLRGERVILDSDLAEVYGVETKRLNEQVRRNAAKFDEKYVFQLTKEEHESLRSQSATSKSGRGGRRYPPGFSPNTASSWRPPCWIAKKRLKPANSSSTSSSR